MIFPPVVILGVTGLLALTAVALPMPHAVPSGQQVDLARRYATTESVHVYRRVGDEEKGAFGKFADKVTAKAGDAHTKAALRAPYDSLGDGHARAAFQLAAGSDGSSSVAKVFKGAAHIVGATVAGAAYHKITDDEQRRIREKQAIKDYRDRRAAKKAAKNQ